MIASGRVSIEAWESGACIKTTECSGVGITGGVDENSPLGPEEVFFIWVCLKRLLGGSMAGRSVVEDPVVFHPHLAKWNFLNRII